MSPSVKPALVFNESPYVANALGNLLAEFRQRGFVVLPELFEPDSVDAFRAQVRSALDDQGQLPDDSLLKVWPTMSPRMRQVAEAALSPDRMGPAASLFEASWLVAQQAEQQKDQYAGWHKDRTHEVFPVRDYVYPRDVHVGMYFRDMDEDAGPTQIIPGSHRDAELSPWSGAETAAFTIRKQDAVLWDQRCWHRGTNCLAEGPRIFALFGFYAVPVYHQKPHRISAAQRQLLLDATDPAEQVLYGGPFGRSIAKP